MNNYTYSDELRHYGVLGMRWGVRRNPEQAYYKATKKAKKLNFKASKKRMKADKYSLKAQKAYKKLNSKTTNDENREKREAKYDKYLKKSNRLNAKADRYSDKASRWASKMDSVFGKLRIDDLPKADIDAGKEYVNYVWALNSEASAREVANTARRYIDQTRGGRR